VTAGDSVGVGVGVAPAARGTRVLHPPGELEEEEELTHAGAAMTSPIRKARAGRRRTGQPPACGVRQFGTLGACGCQART
jgi:hypothetical protein